MTFKSNAYALRWNDGLELCVPWARTELVKEAFKYAAPTAWNSLQEKLKLENLVSYGQFKGLVKNLEADTIGNCTCFQN